MNGLRDKRPDEEILAGVLAMMSPLTLLNVASAQLIREAGRIDLRETFELSAVLTATPSADERAAMEAQSDARRRMLEDSPRFQAALARVGAAGVRTEWGDDCDHSYTARLLYFVVPPKALPRLEDLAADDAGIDGWWARRKAAVLYRRWLLQNYDPDWQRYRQKWTIVEESPYRGTGKAFRGNPDAAPDRI